MSIDVLKEDIKKNTFKNLYLFYGPEEYLKKYYFDSIVSRTLGEEMKALNLIVLEGKVEDRRIIEAAETMPVFSEKKVVLVKNSSILKAKKKGGEGNSKGKSRDDELLNYLQNVPDYTCLVFYENEIDKRVKVVDIIKKNGLIVEFAYQKPVELVKWAMNIFKSHKKEIDQSTAAALIDNCEPGMTEIRNEIDKLILYLGGKSRVSGEDLEKVCTKSIKGRIFDLTDAIAAKNTILALQFLNEMVVLKEPLPKVLYMITRQFRQLLQMKLLLADGLKVHEAAVRIGMNPYSAGKMQKQSGSFSLDMLKKSIEDSLELDLAVKTGRMNDRLALELLITKCCK